MNWQIMIDWLIDWLRFALSCVVINSARETFRDVDWTCSNQSSYQRLQRIFFYFFFLNSQKPNKIPNIQSHYWFSYCLYRECARCLCPTFFCFFHPTKWIKNYFKCSVWRLWLWSKSFTRDPQAESVSTQRSTDTFDHSWCLARFSPFTLRTFRFQSRHLKIPFTE